MRRVLLAVLTAGVISSASSAEVPENCKLDLPEQGAVTAVFGVGEGASYTDIRLGAQNTRVVRVVVSPGPMPVYVVFPRNRSSVNGRSDPIIWKFEGAIERVKRVTLPLVGAGVVGLPENRVSFSSCFILPGAGGRASQAAEETAAALLGRKPDFIGGNLGSVYGVKIPSLETFQVDPTKDNVPPPGLSEQQWDKLITYYTNTPGEYIPLVGESVVTRDVVAAETGLRADEGMAGLMLLINAGSVVETNERARGGAGKLYRIVKKIDSIPKNLPAFSTAFVLAPGVPMPKSTGDVSIFMEDEGVTYCMTPGRC